MLETAILMELARMELRQREEEGCDVSALRREFERAADLSPVEKRAFCEGLWKRLDALEQQCARAEPSDLDGIRAARPEGPRTMQTLFSVPELRQRTAGGWFGRCVGCLLGKPVEGRSRAEIHAVAAADGNVPIRDYLAPLTVQVAGVRLAPDDPCLRGNIRGMVRDDDIDYTILNLLLLERKGFDFRTSDVARFWLQELPFHRVYTAERVAYRNLVNGIAPEVSGGFRNPCREWIGAQIRADAFGYACPGQPERAAELAWRDAWLSHRKNGLYGAMFVAAMIAAAYCEPDVRRIVEIGLSEIPDASRLAEAVRNVSAWWERECDWISVAEKIDEHYGALQGCHTITNAAIVVLGLLASEGDFTEGISIALMAGYDTDCNGATVGSILGVRNGLAGIPEHWIAPLEDRVETAVVSVGREKISELARRSAAVALRGLAEYGDESGTPPTWEGKG